MRLVLSALLIMLASASPAIATPCQEPQLESVDRTHPACRFYTGTRHYREKDFASASREWRALVDMQELPKAQEHYQLSAMNNLGYLYFMGLGVEKDQARAIRQYWIPADKAGHEEATYHLCHAYADANKRQALGYCREALRRYERLQAKEADADVIAELRRYIARLQQS